jgi:hypothetical protein
MKEYTMRNYLRGAVASAMLVASTACASGATPAARAAGVERLQCDPSALSQEQLVRSLTILHVEPIYSHVMTGNNNDEDRVNGAKLIVRPPKDVSADEMTRVLQCHGARVLLGQLGSVVDDPYWLPDRWVSIKVTPEDGNFAVSLSADTIHDNLQVFSHASHYAGEHVLATDPGLP